MNEEPSQVVVAFDFSHSAHAALHRAMGVASRAPWHVLHFVAVIDPHQPLPGVPAKKVDLEYVELVKEALTTIVLLELESRLIADRVHFFVHALIGKPAKEILGVARDVGADLIIVGSRGVTGLERVLVGSVSEKVAREAHCTVEIARPKTYAHVPLLEVTDKLDGHDKYDPPHRYNYKDQRQSTRPNDWPLY
jgi:nucleotide-binding universal stress UspA family protein